MRGNRRQWQGGCGAVRCCQYWLRIPLPRHQRRRALVRREPSTGLGVIDTPTPPPSPPAPRSVRLWVLETAAARPNRHHTRGGMAARGSGGPATSGQCQPDLRRRRATAVPVATGPAGGDGHSGAVAGRLAAHLLHSRGGSPQTAVSPHSPAKPGGSADHRPRQRGRSPPPGSRVCQPCSPPFIKLFSSAADSRRLRCGGGGGGGRGSGDAGPTWQAGPPLGRVVATRV